MGSKEDVGHNVGARHVVGLTTSQCQGETDTIRDWTVKATRVGEEETQGWRIESRKTETRRRKKEVGTDRDRQRYRAPKMEERFLGSRFVP